MADERRRAASLGPGRGRPRLRGWDRPRGAAGRHRPGRHRIPARLRQARPARRHRRQPDRPVGRPGRRRRSSPAGTEGREAWPPTSGCGCGGRSTSRSAWRSAWPPVRAGPAALPAVRAVRSEHPPPAGDTGQAGHRRRPRRGRDHRAVLLLLAVGAPVVEELFFRGLLLRSLARRFSRRRSPSPARPSCSGWPTSSCCSCRPWSCSASSWASWPTDRPAGPGHRGPHRLQRRHRPDADAAPLSTDEIGAARSRRVDGCRWRVRSENGQREAPCEVSEMSVPSTGDDRDVGRRRARRLEQLFGTAMCGGGKATGAAAAGRSPGAGRRSQALTAADPANRGNIAVP